MGVGRHLKKVTKILTVALPYGVALEVKEDEEKGTFTCYFFQLCIIEFSTNCMYCRKEVGSFAIHCLPGRHTWLFFLLHFKYLICDQAL